MARGLRDGLNPRTNALNIVGRINRTTGRREGGIVGLHSLDIEAVSRARSELSDPSSAAAFLKRGLRDRTYDSKIKRSVREGKALTRSEIDKIAGRYADRLLLSRGQRIARTEMIGAIHAAQFEAAKQAVDSGRVRLENVRKVWSATGDDRVRDGHRRLHGESVGLEELFISPITGKGMLYPHDTSNGAHGEDVINCRCRMNIRIDFLSNLR